MRIPLIVCIVLFGCAGAIAQQPTRNTLGLALPSKYSCTPVKDQYISSTCWSFSSISLLESELMRIGKGKLDLSEMFIARHSMERKIARHLQLKGGNFFTPGGQFHDAVWVMKKYGAVPEEVYSGKGRGEGLHDHSEMDTLLSQFVDSCISRGVTSLNAFQQAFLDSSLDYYYGKLPVSFSYKGKSYTPQTFLHQYLQINPDDYAEITSYSHHPWYSKFVLEDKYNWTAGEYYNVPLSDFSRITDRALDSGFSVGWDGDAKDNYFDFAEGLAWLPGAISNFQAERQQAFEDQSTLLDHMMHIVARTTDAKRNKWYYVKNSWGDKSNSLGGFLYMREDYFKMRTVAIIVNKKAIPADIRRKLGI
jgi:bleomycin hydrolase